MERTHRVFEAIKTILIVALTISAVLLLSFYWADFSLDSLFAKKTTDDTPVQTADAPKTREIIAPVEIDVRLAGESSGAYAILFPEEFNAWQTVLSAFSAFSRSEGAHLEETTEAVYRSLSGARSIRVAFACALPFDGFCKQFGIASAPFAAVSAMDELVWSEAHPDSVFLRNGTDGALYRLVGSAETLAGLPALTEEVSAGSKRIVFPITTMLGEQNDALIPIEYSGTVYDASLEKAVHDAKRDTDADRFARSFFDNSLDFVRRVEDSKGLLTYIYNYTQKVLTVSINGIAEYKEELAAQTVTQGFYASLGTALSFVAEHGGWYPDLIIDGNAQEEGPKPFLLNASEISSGHRNGYRFSFAFRVGQELLYTGGEPLITVDVYDGQVTYYRRALFANVSLTKREGAEDAAIPSNVITNNIDWTYSALINTGVAAAGAVEERERRAIIAQAIDRVKSGYLADYTTEADTADAKAVWVVRCGKTFLFFDLLTGDPVRYSKNAE